MISFIALFRLLAASQVVLTFAVLMRSRNPARVKVVLAGLGLGVLGYLILPLLGPPAAENLVVVLPPLVFSNAIPMFLWAACRMFFNDEVTLPRLGVLTALAAIVLVVVGFVRAHILGTPEGFELLVLRGVPQLIKLGFAALAIHVALVGREMDLVEPRRRARRWFASGLGMLVAIVIVAELATAFRVPGWLEGFGMLVMFILALGLNLLLLPRHPAFELRTPPVPVDAAALTDPLLIELERIMRNERAYADYELRIGGLASTLGTAEHKLRDAINGALGYRNFNQYVNRYRIDEAARRLHTEPELPVLSIALDVGFRSLSAFNKAFRDIEGCTPTVYRQRPSDS